MSLKNLEFCGSMIDQYLAWRAVSSTAPTVYIIETESLGAFSKRISPLELLTKLLHHLFEVPPALCLPAMCAAPIPFFSISPPFFHGPLAPINA